VLVVTQLALLQGVTPPTMRARVRRLVRRGLVQVDDRYARAPAGVLITGAGLRQIGSSLSPPTANDSQLRHDIGVGWVWVAARRGAFGEISELVSERRMRSSDARREPLRAPGERYGIGVETAGPANSHFADMLIRTRGGRAIAVEVELHAKGAWRLDRVMHAYAGDPRISDVLYLVPSRHLGDPVFAAAERAGIADRVHVQLIAGGGAIEGAPAPVSRTRGAPCRTAGRVAGRLPSRSHRSSDAHHVGAAESFSADRGRAQGLSL